MVGATEPAGGGDCATDAGVIRGRALVTKSCGGAGSDRGYKPMCARWRSTAAIAAAVTASTICCREGGGSALGAFSMLEFVAREGRRCVSRGLNIRDGNGGPSLPLRSAAGNM